MYKQGINKLLGAQKKLKLNIINFNLSEYWNTHILIRDLRERIKPFLNERITQSDIPFDPQDLEHQVLFSLSTFSSPSITEADIGDIFEQQYRIIRERLLDNSNLEELRYLFRGLKNSSPDLNISDRLKLKWENGILVAVAGKKKFEVEFRKITDKPIISLFTDIFHYIHQSRIQGDTFALFFKGDRYPWAVETAENSIYARQYKRMSLLANGFHPDKGIELTRFYTLPGAPTNAISVMDRLVKEYYQKNTDIQVLFTKTMPSYSKSKSTTVSGGLNKVLCVNELEHVFIRRKIGGLDCWEHVSKRWLEKSEYKENDLKYSNSGFGLLPAVDVYMEINKRSIQPIPELEEANKAVYFSKNDISSFNNDNNLYFHNIDDRNNTKAP